MRLPTSSFHAAHVRPMEIGVEHLGVIHPAYFRLLDASAHLLVEQAERSVARRAQPFRRLLAVVEHSLVRLDGKKLPKDPAIRLDLLLGWPAWLIEDLAQAATVAFALPDMVLESVFNETHYRRRTLPAWLAWKACPAPPPWHVQQWAFVVYHQAMDLKEARDERRVELRLLVAELLQVTGDVEGRKLAANFVLDKPMDEESQHEGEDMLHKDPYWYWQPPEPPVPMQPPRQFRVRHDDEHPEWDSPWSGT